MHCLAPLASSRLRQRSTQIEANNKATTLNPGIHDLDVMTSNFGGATFTKMTKSPLKHTKALSLRKILCGRMRPLKLVGANYNAMELDGVRYTCAIAHTSLRVPARLARHL
eukprot:3221929-Pleurochrysis_carterae.AAC.2